MGRFFIALGVLLFLGEGCASAKPSHSFSLHPAVAVETSAAFQRALAAPPRGAEWEKARIDYLLERVSESPYNFIRNGVRYTGKRGWAHLRWKYFRRRNEVTTAEEFIDRVATGSVMSGRPYLIELDDKTRYPLRLFLLSELKAFDEATKALFARRVPAEEGT